MTSQTTPQTLNVPSQRLLRALFELARVDQAASAGSLARLLGRRAVEVAQLLVQLDQLGLVRAERARLTLPGLLVATRLPALGLPLTAQPGALREATAASERRARVSVARRSRQEPRPGRPRAAFRDPSVVSL
jgi:hypothetical protein